MEWRSTKSGQIVIDVQGLKQLLQVVNSYIGLREILSGYNLWRNHHICRAVLCTVVLFVFLVGESLQSHPTSHTSCSNAYTVALCFSVYLITTPGLLSLNTLKQWSPVDGLPLERPATACPTWCYKAKKLRLIKFKMWPLKRAICQSCTA
jgi:hypothetical protein